MVLNNIYIFNVFFFLLKKWGLDDYDMLPFWNILEHLLIAVVPMSLPRIIASTIWQS